MLACPPFPGLPVRSIGLTGRSGSLSEKPFAEFWRFSAGGFSFFQKFNRIQQKFNSKFKTVQNTAGQKTPFRQYLY
jgi:hypothetical protein